MSKKMRVGDVLVEVADVSVDGGREAYGREGGVEDDRVGILEASGQPFGGDERVMLTRLLRCA